MDYTTTITPKIDFSQLGIIHAKLVEDDKTIKELQHFKDSNTGLWAIDRDPKTVSFEWIKDNCFQIS